MAEETKKKEAPKKTGEHQDDLAEGELETVEESLRIHEEADKAKQNK
ncbi:MAG TPA: hypothetical protein VN442_22955 [Bryobacteraceae bacterium]|nr:hypothetical protein [Bryobacteraceae bacterium]